MQRVMQKLQWLKGITFELMFVIQHHSITNKHLLVLVELLQIFPLTYFYLNPLYSQLHNFHMLEWFFQIVWPEIFLFASSQGFLLALILLTIFPTVLLTVIMMKCILGYQYLIIVAIQLWLLVYPLFFVKFTIETFNAMIGFQDHRTVGILVAIVHTIGSVMALHLYDKKHKLIDMLPVLLIYLNANQYAVLAVVALRLVLSHLIAPNTLIKPLRTRIQSALLIVLVFGYFASDNFTNYIAFVLVLSVFSLTQLLSIIRKYNDEAPIFYHLENLNQEESESRLKYYDFVEEHRMKCENALCMCRQLGQFKSDEEIKRKGYEFVKSLYEFREDFESRIQLGAISCQQYQFTLSGLLMILQLKPSSLYEQYLLYYIKTNYEQQYRKHDKNHSFGQEYHNAYEDLRNFQQKIQTLTKVLKQFWNTILYFDGSKKFLALILDISEQITRIKDLYELYVDKYEEFGNQFQYLYKTFEIAILNLLDKEIQQSQNTFGVVKQDIQIKVPERLLFFISNAHSKIVNCNRDFSNLVETDKHHLINRSYAQFIPPPCSQLHSSWVTHWYQHYNRDEQAKQAIKPILLSNDYMRAVKMQNKILPRFDQGIEIITFIKLTNKLEQSSISKSSELNKEGSGEMDDQEAETFFSFLIQKQTMKIVAMDEGFFYTTMIDKSQELRKKILGVRINDLFPKIVLKSKESTSQSESARQVMLSYSAFQQFTECKQRILAMNSIQTMSRNTTLMRLPSKPASNESEEEQRFSYGRKTTKKHTTFGMNIGGTMNTVMKEGGDQVFLYEIVEQVNSGMDVQYCIANFKLKKSIASEQQTKHKEQQQQKSKGLSDKPSDAQKNIDASKASSAAQQFPQDQQQSKLLPKAQNSLFANLSHRQPFIRSSKPYQEQDGKKEIETKKAQLQESEEFGNQQKNYCLPWPILLPLFLVHFIYTQVSAAYADTFVYLQKTFDFYDKYELEILKQLHVPFANNSYHQELKALWMQGYGFYHSSILTFQNPTDPYFVDKLYNEVIKDYHFGIYQQIHASLKVQINDIHLFYYIIIVVLSVFLLYVVVDFVLNLRYCFRISSKVTQIILIFLNISQSDINRLIYSITKYQTEVLQIVNFDDIQQQKKILHEDYKIHDPENRQAAELSGIGLLKEDPYALYLQSNLNNVDHLQSDSPLKNSEPIESLNELNKPLKIVPQVKKPNKRNSSLLNHKRRNSRVEKLDFQKLKQSITNIRSPPSEAASQKNILLHQHKRNTSISRSSFSNNTSFNSDPQGIKIQFPENHVMDKIEQDDSELSPEEESKLLKIANFKRKFRGKLNDVRENPRSYLLLLMVLILTLGVLVTVFVLIPKFIANFDTFSNVYFNLRKLRIVLFKELIEKATLIPLEPSVKASVYSQDFYFQVQEQLSGIPKFQEFWKTIYSNNVCPHLSDLELKKSCEGLDNLMTSFGQKVMFQYLEDFLRRKNGSQLFQSKTKEAVEFMTISQLQGGLVTEGDKSMSNQMNGYLQDVGNLEMIIAAVGTAIFILCLIMLNKALKDIRLKIKDGENLLLVMPQNIKKKYIEQMKKNRMKELTMELTHEQEKRRGKKKKTKKVEMDKQAMEEVGAETAVELMGNSSVIREEDKLLKNSLKNSQSSMPSIANSKECVPVASTPQNPSKFKQ